MLSSDSADPRQLSRRSLLALAGGAGALLAIPAALAHDDDDDDKDDHDSSGHGSGHDDHADDRDDDHEDGSDGSDDDGKVAPLGTVPPGSAEVRVVDDDADAFQPGTITVDLGGQVTFVNLDDDPHTATGAGFDTGNIDPGGQVTVTFDAPGTFPFACQYHPVMTGSIAVRDASGAMPGTPAASPVASPSAGATAEVAIVDFAFDPAELSVAAGTTVTWTNRDTVPHTATGDDGSFDTGTLDPGASASHTFATAGTFAYFCAFHPNMTGTVIVT
jgi:plastocyanin